MGYKYLKIVGLASCPSSVCYLDDDIHIIGPGLLSPGNLVVDRVLQLTSITCQL